MSLEQFSGNLLTGEEKEYRLMKLEEEIENNQVDEEFIPYLRLINNIPFFVTTQCCTGHGSEDDRQAHFDFRSCLRSEIMIDDFLKPISKIFPQITVSLYGLHCDRLRYAIWMPSDQWEEITAYFIGYSVEVKRKYLKTLLEDTRP